MGKPVGWRATDGILDYYQLIGVLQQALDVEIEMVKTRSPDFDFDLRDGAFVFRSMDYFIYRFPLKRDIKINDDTPVDILIDNRNMGGFIVTSGKNSIDEAIPENCGSLIVHY